MVSRMVLALFTSNIFVIFAEGIQFRKQTESIISLRSGGLRLRRVGEIILKNIREVASSGLI